jgi:hypothetical protein
MLPLENLESFRSSILGNVLQQRGDGKTVRVGRGGRLPPASPATVGGREINVSFAETAAGAAL